MRLLCLFLALSACLPLRAEGLRPLDDAALAGVQGRDGLSFDLANFAMSGDARITYTTAAGNASLTVANPALSRSDDPNRPFSDPFRLDIVRRDGLADMATIAFPENPDAAARWQAALDLSVSADGIDRDLGSVVVRDLVLQGGGLQLTTPRNGDGFALGLSLRADIGNLLLRPRGRGDTTLADGAAEQMNFSGIRIGAADAQGNVAAAPWRIADATAQPLVVNLVRDETGTPRLRAAIEWPDANGAATGALQIGNLSFRSDVTGNLDLGSSRIGGIQIQYLDIRFRP